MDHDAPLPVLDFPSEAPAFRARSRAPRPRMAEARSAILGMGYALPEIVVSSDEVERAANLAEKFGLQEGHLERVLGVKERHMAPPTANPSDLAMVAARKAMDQAGVAPGELDVIVFAAVTRDPSEASTAHVMQERLGARSAYVFDVANGCRSVLDAIHLVDSLIGGGRCRRALVCSAELGSRMLRDGVSRLRTDEGGRDLASVLPSLGLGDAGVALVLGKAIRRGGAVAAPRSFKCFEFAARGEQAMARVLERTGWTLDQIDLIVPHHAPTRERHGDTASCQVPLALMKAQEEGRLHRGDKVVLAGLGFGLTAGFATMIW
jgi:3-oxoacyl-[acyl-carrier-protein] synthase III